jgi:hypothetical protein
MTRACQVRAPPDLQEVPMGQECALLHMVPVLISFEGQL